MPSAACYFKINSNALLTSTQTPSSLAKNLNSIYMYSPQNKQGQLNKYCPGYKIESIA